MEDWSQDLTPEPARAPPPKMMDFSVSEIWDADQSSLPSLPDPFPAAADDDNNTFSSEKSLEARVQATLHSSVPKSVLSQHLRHQPLTKLEPNRDRPTASFRQTKSSSYKTNTTTVPREVKLEHHLEKLRRELAQANAKIVELTQSPISGEEEVTKLHKTIEVLSASNTRLAEEKESLRILREEESSRCINLETALKDAQHEFGGAKKEVQACRQELEDVTTRLTEQQTAADNANTKCQELEVQLAENSSQDTRDMRELRKSNHELHTREQKIVEENKELRKQAEERMVALDAKCKECLTLTNERTILRRRLEKAPTSQNVSVQTDSVQTKCMEVQTDSVAGGVDASSISERLTRVREATERTGLLRQHQDEVAHLTEDHEQTISDLERRHVQRLQEAEEQAAEEQATKMQQVRRSLTTEHQKRLDEMERRHRRELAKIREERDRKLGTTTDSLEAALAQVTAATEQLEQESQKRLDVESNLETLRHDYAHEKKYLLEQHQNDIETFRISLEEERTSLLDEVQRGCNQVIVASRRLVVTPASTKTASTHFDFDVRTMRQEVPRLRELSPISQTTTSTTANQPLTDKAKQEVPLLTKLPPSSQTRSSMTLSQSLAETEAFVLQVLGGTCL